jgi:hypothetical protein
MLKEAANVLMDSSLGYRMANQRRPPADSRGRRSVDDRETATRLGRGGERSRNILGVG